MFKMGRHLKHTQHKCSICDRIKKWEKVFQAKTVEQWQKVIHKETKVEKLQLESLNTFILLLDHYASSKCIWLLPIPKLSI